MTTCVVRNDQYPYKSDISSRASARPKVAMTAGDKTGTDLDEGLDLAPLRDLLRTHTLRYLERVTLDAGNDCMGVWPLLGALVELLDDDNLPPRLAALEDDSDLMYARTTAQFRVLAKVDPFEARTLPGL